MFHKLTPRTPGLSRVWNVPQGTVQIGPPLTNGNQTGGGTYQGLRGSLNSPATLMVVANQNWQGANKPVAIIAIGLAGQRAVEIIGPNIAGKSYGLLIIAGTNASDQPLLISNAANNATYMSIYGDGHGTLGPSATLGLSWTAAGTVTLDAPTSGGHFVDGANAGVTLALQNVSGGDGRTVLRFVNPANTQTWDIGVDTSGGSTLAWSIRNLTTAGTPLSISATTNGVTIAAPGSGNSLTVNSVANGVGILINAAAGVTGLQVIQTSTAGVAGYFQTAAGTPLQCVFNGSTNFIVNGITAPTIQGWGPTAAALVDMTPDTGTFTGTLTGCTTSPTGTCRWVRIGNLVLLFIPIITGTSSSTALTITGLPAVIQPARTMMFPVGDLEDAGVLTGTFAGSVANASGTITFYKNGSASGFTNSATTKGVSAAQVVAYLLN